MPDAGGGFEYQHALQAEHEWIEARLENTEDDCHSRPNRADHLHSDIYHVSS